MLKVYKFQGLTYQFEEGKQPAGAVLVDAPKAKAVEPETKVAKPANKAVRGRTKCYARHGDTLS